MSQVESPNMKTIEGSVWYRERMLLPPEAEVHVTLEDISRMDVKSELIAETRFIPKGGPPFSFTLSYDPAKIHDNGRWALRAHIQLDDKLMFTSTDHIPAFSNAPDQPVEILVKRVASTN
jgi:putative lipoprotein